MRQVRQRNGVKPPETQVLDIKYVVQNETDILEHRNDVQIPKMWVLDQKTTLNQMHADTSFCNGSGASTKWRETFENMSFGPK